MEQTFVMVKPDGVQRNLIGEIVQRFEKKGYTLKGAKLMSISRELAEKHYGEHKEKPFFEELVGFITSSPVFAMVLEGDEVVFLRKKTNGSYKPAGSRSRNNQRRLRCSYKHEYYSWIGFSRKRRKRNCSLF